MDPPAGGQRLTQLIIPSAMPKIFTGFRLSLSLALILMVFCALAAQARLCPSCPGRVRGR